MWDFETKECRRGFAMSRKRFYKLKGKYSVWSPWSTGESRGEKVQLGGRCLSWSEGPGTARGTLNPNQESLGRIYGVWETRAAHTQWAACPWLQHQLGESRWEFLAPMTLRGTRRLWSALTNKDCLPFGEVKCVENQAVAWSCSVGATRGLFYKRGVQVWLSREPKHPCSCPANKQARFSLCPLNPAGQDK